MLNYHDIKNGNLDAIRNFALSHDLNCQIAHGTPLTLAAFEGRIRVVKLLLALGADPNYPVTKNGWTPLIAAANDGHNRIVEILINAGANLNLSDLNGNTALHHVSACPRKCRFEVASTLILHGADKLQNNNNCLTPYQLALERQKHSYLVDIELLNNLMYE